MAMPKKTDDAIVVSQIQMSEMRFNIVGTTPLMPHSASAHAKGQLLFPSPKKNAAERSMSLKHNVFAEYRDAAYQFSDAEVGATRMYMPASAIKAALRDVAIDMIGAKKAQIGRLTTVVGFKLPLFGTPKLNTMMVRSSDMNRTPDIRTLPCLERWAIPNVLIRFVSLIKEQSMPNLLANAGIIIGIGDGRPQHGYFDFGTFRLAQDGDRELREIMATGGRKAQEKALADPQFLDLETENLVSWFLAEQKKRAAAPPPPSRRRTATTPAITPPPKANGRGRPKKETRLET